MCVCVCWIWILSSRVIHIMYRSCMWREIISTRTRLYCLKLWQGTQPPPRPHTHNQYNVDRHPDVTLDSYIYTLESYAMRGDPRIHVYIIEHGICIQLLYEWISCLFCAYTRVLRCTAHLVLLYLRSRAVFAHAQVIFE